MSTKKTIIFDFDGTLADSFELVSDLFYELTGHEHITDKKRIQALRQLPLGKVIKELNVPAYRIPRLLIVGRKQMAERISEVNVFDGMPEVLEKLHQKHRLLIMSSNSEHNVRAFLAVHNLTDCFDEVYGGVGLFTKAGALKKVLRRSRLSSDDCIYVGDEARDIVSAHKAGVPIVSVAWGYNDAKVLQESEPLAVAKTPAELLEILEK